MINTPIHPDIQEVLFTENELNSATERIASEIMNDFKNSDKKLLLIGILKGSVVFMTDLMRKIDMPLCIDFMQASSYGSGTTSSGKVEMKLDIKYTDLSDYNVVVIEDILDTGNTLSYILDVIRNKNAASVKLCVLLNKPDRRVINIDVDYQGMVIPDAFVVGYGLDYNEQYRHLPYIGILKPEVYSN